MDGGRKAAALMEGKIVHLLEEWGAGHEPPNTSGDTGLAARLGQWVGWRDAVDLAAALSTPVRASRIGLSLPSVERDLASISDLRTRLAQPLEVPALGDRPAEPSMNDIDASFAIGRRLYLARRQAAARAIGSLRSCLRALLVEMGAERLAAIDAVMERVLGTRQEALYVRLLHALERRACARATEAHSATPPALLEDLHKAWEAELEYRLLPLEGLADALRARTTN